MKENIMIALMVATFFGVLISGSSGGCKININSGPMEEHEAESHDEEHHTLTPIPTPTPTPVPYAHVFLVTATVYNPVPSQTDSTPLITASGFKIDPEDPDSQRICALSRNLLKRWGGPFSYGDKIFVEGAGEFSGEWTVQDTMNARYVNYMDFCTSKTTGKWPDVKIVKR